MLQGQICIVQSASIKDWARPAATFHELIKDDLVGRSLQGFAASTLRCRPPMLIDRPSERSLFFPRGGLKESYEVPLPEIRLDTVPRGLVVGSKFVVVSHDLRVFSESYWAEQNLNDGTHFQRQASTVVGAASIQMRPTILFHERPVTRQIKGPALLLGNPWSFNYHHWIVNCLARLWWIERYSELRDVPVIVPGDLNTFQQQSLKGMNVAADRILPFDGGQWLVDRLFFPTNGDFWPQQLRWIRQRLFDHFGIVDSPGERLLYISRSDAHNRRILNEPDVAQYLAAKGFERLELAAMPLGEQIRAFSQARLIVGPHGSGLTNIMFGAENLGTLELHPNDEVNHVFWVLANAMQQQYAFVSGTKVNADRDFTVQIADLDAMIARLI